MPISSGQKSNTVLDYNYRDLELENCI